MPGTAARFGAIPTGIFLFRWIGAVLSAALETLPGKHDFAAFQAAGGTAKTTVRTIRSVDLEIRGNEWILTVTGNAFLYNMVRIIAGTVAEIGLGRLEPDAFETLLRQGPPGPWA